MNVLKDFISCTNRYRILISRLNRSKIFGVDVNLLYDLIYLKEYLSCLCEDNNLKDIYSLNDCLDSILMNINLERVIDRKKLLDRVSVNYDLISKLIINFSVCMALLATISSILRNYTLFGVISWIFSGIFGVLIFYTGVLICIFGVLLVDLFIINNDWYRGVSIENSCRFKRNIKSLFIMSANICGDNGIDNEVSELVQKITNYNSSIELYKNIVKVEFLYNKYRQKCYCTDLEFYMKGFKYR